MPFNIDMNTQITLLVYKFSDPTEDADVYFAVVKGQEENKEIFKGMERTATRVIEERIEDSGVLDDTYYEEWQDPDEPLGGGYSSHVGGAFASAVMSYVSDPEDTPTSHIASEMLEYEYSPLEQVDAEDSFAEKTVEDLSERYVEKDFNRMVSSLQKYGYAYLSP